VISDFTQKIHRIGFKTGFARIVNGNHGLDFDLDGQIAGVYPTGSFDAPAMESHS